MDRQAAIESAILRLTPDQFTKTGKPALGAINEHLKREGFNSITAKERDVLWAERVAEAATAGDAAAEPDGPTSGGLELLHALGRALHLEPEPPAASVKIRIVSAMSDPVPLYVHGVGHFTIRVGETVELPKEALEALRNSDCTFTQE